MRPLSATDLLGVWEAGRHQPHWERGLHLLAASSPESTRSDLLELSVGERDRRLLELRQMIFGPDLEALVECPVCRESLHLAFPLKHVFAASSRPSHEVEASGYRIEFRPVNSG